MTDGKICHGRFYLFQKLSFLTRHLFWVPSATTVGGADSGKSGENPARARRCDARCGSGVSLPARGKRRRPRKARVRIPAKERQIAERALPRDIQEHGAVRPNAAKGAVLVFHEHTAAAKGAVPRGEAEGKGAARGDKRAERGTGGGITGDSVAGPSLRWI